MLFSACRLPRLVGLMAFASMVACNRGTRHPAAQRVPSIGGQAPSIAGRYLVTFDDSVTDVDGAGRRLARLGNGRMLGLMLGFKGVVLAGIPDTLVPRLRAVPGVRHIRPDALDTLYESKHLSNVCSPSC